MLGEGSEKGLGSQRVSIKILGVSLEMKVEGTGEAETALGLSDGSWLPTRKSFWLENIFENIPLGSKPDIPLIIVFFFWLVSILCG